LLGSSLDSSLDYSPQQRHHKKQQRNDMTVPLETLVIGPIGAGGVHGMLGAGGAP